MRVRKRRGLLKEVKGSIPEKGKSGEGAGLTGENQEFYFAQGKYKKPIRYAREEVRWDLKLGL